jgi:hypothetical protein
MLVDLKAQASNRYVAPFDLALIYLGLGSKSAMYEGLDKAYEDRSHWCTWIKADLRFDDVRDDPRYQDLLRRMKLPV